jgi:hypothetical protein
VGIAMIDFPASPVVGQLATLTNGVTYRWDGTIWVATGQSAGGSFCAVITAAFNSTAAYGTLIPTTIVSGNTDGSYSTSTGQYRPPAGRYQISGTVTGSYSGAVHVYLQLRKNGAMITYNVTTSATNGYYASPEVSAIVDANGSDVFDLQAMTQSVVGSFSSVMFQAFPISGIKGPPGDATPGTLIQTVSFQTGAVATGTTIIPVDNTVPQITEGNEYMTCAITPRSATSKLVIEVTAYLSSSIAGTANIVAALFQDSAANALAAGWVSAPNTGSMVNIVFKHTMVSGMTSPTTFRMRAGAHAAGTTTFNGSGGAAYLGGVMASSIVIQEVV